MPKCLPILASLLLTLSIGLHAGPTPFTQKGYPELEKQLINSKLPTTIDEQSLEELYHRFYIHYKDYIGENPKELTYEFLMGDDNPMAKFQLAYTFDLAIASGLDVSRFSNFAIDTNENGSVIYRFKDSIHLTKLSTLLKPLFNGNDFANYRNRLIEMGLTSKEVDTLVRYKNRVNSKTIMNTERYYYYRYLSSIKDSMINAVKHRHTYNTEHYQSLLLRQWYASQYISFFVHRQIADDFFVQLTPRAQRIVKVFLVENIKTYISSKPKPLEQTLKDIEKNIKSGKFKKQIETQLKKYLQKELI